MISKKDREEALTIIWELREKKDNNIDRAQAEIAKRLSGEIFDLLIKEQDIAVDSKKNVDFTDQTKSIAKDLMRRQRLAERLLTDVLEIGPQNLEDTACEFEHIISKEVEESICTLLGHPRQCPHGHIIPEGACCKNAACLIESVVTQLSKLKPSQEAKILYLISQAHPQLHKLMALGLVPGAHIRVHQVFPSFVINVENTEIALEEEVAQTIFVKKI